MPSTDDPDTGDTTEPPEDYELYEAAAERMDADIEPEELAENADVMHIEPGETVELDGPFWIETTEDTLSIRKRSLLARLWDALPFTD